MVGGIQPTTFLNSIYIGVLMLNGLGIGHLPILHENILEHRHLFEFVEITPESFMGGDFDLAKNQIADVRKNFYITCHGIDLSLCSVEEVDTEHIAGCKEVIELCQPLFFSEHLAFTRCHNLNSDIYFPPFYLKSDVERIANKCLKISDYFELPFYLENVPDFLLGKSGIGEGEFFSSLFDLCGTRVILNLDSICLSAKLQNIPPIDLIRTYPIEQIASVTVVPESCMNPVIRKMCGGFDDEMLGLVEFCINNTTARSVLIQTRYETNTVESLIDIIGSLRNLIDGADQ